MSALTLLLATLVGSVAGAASAEPGGGNNGTVKIDGAEIGNSNEPDNDPKPSCVFDVEFFGFPESATPTVTFTSQGNTQPAQTVIPVQSGDVTPALTGSGPGNTFEGQETFELDLTGFTPNPDGSFIVKVTITDQADSNFTKSKVFKLLCEPAVTIDKDDAGARVMPGDELTYTLTVTNDGQQDESDFQVTDTLPAGLTLESVAGDGFDCEATVGNDIDCTFTGTLSPDETALLTVETTVDEDVVGSVIENSATVTVRGVSDTDEETTPVDRPETVLSVTVDKLNDADGDGTFTDEEEAGAEGAAATFTVTITNTSDVAVVIDSIEDAFGDTTLDDICEELTGKTLAANASVTCTFVVQDYAPAIGSELKNTVTVVVSEQNNPDNTAIGRDDSTVVTPAVTPITPGTPGEPAAPGTPGEPAAPGTPGEPAAPGTPGEPAPEPVAVLPIAVVRPLAPVLPVIAPPSVDVRGGGVTQPSVVSASPSDAVARRTAQPAALPFTGSAADTLLTTAAGLLLLGCASMVAGRRRRTAPVG